MSMTILLLTTGALVFISAAVQHLNTISARGLSFVFTDRAVPLSREGFAGRAARTLQNNLESAGMVLPVALVLLVNGVDNALTLLAALAYAAVRIGFTLSYWTGINRLRSFFWGLGMTMIAVLTIQAALLIVPLP
ncbi:hypothetical protein GCM10011321_41890 [Youhaiella tibetensis]|uniref:Uncharacterized protein n=1 Tax=Paradevosia tibetensis TaxID=1447062 RepID=A0A5B9DR55_9HYPH|nr:MAPEG family protein [Youhaiella tibetensis]QEE21911.1 hypothetical protein FNA67_17765 [Youhaiella tibetensis]GGF47100.1 hypothetical protein GCM10011321_41890 [Youhaiella tibetensis]